MEKLNEIDELYYHLKRDYDGSYFKKTNDDVGLYGILYLINNLSYFDKKIIDILTDFSNKCSESDGPFIKDFRIYFTYGHKKWRSAIEPWKWPEGMAADIDVLISNLKNVGCENILVMTGELD